MKACREFRSAMRALLEGELALERTLELEQHAHECGECGPELERARALERALQALPSAPIERLDLERNVRAVLARIDATAPATRARPRLLRYVPWAAAAALAVLLGVQLLQPAPPLPPVPLVQAVDPDLDTTRLESARAEICAALRECLPGFDPASADAQEFAAVVDVHTLELARAGWPCAALVQAAAADADAGLAARALRWLGVHGEGQSRVRAALARPELAPSAVAALFDLGASGIEELRRAPDIAALRALVLQQHARAAQPLLVPWFEDVLARGRADAAESRQLADALVQCGPAALPALLRLATRGALGEDEALARLERIPDADEALGELLGDARASGVDERLLLLAVAEVGAQGGWAWVEREVREGRHEADALQALARGTPEALAVLLRLRAASGVDAQLLQRALERVLRERPDSAAALARESRSRTELAQLFELASAAPEPALVPALLELAGSETLPEPDRRWALLLSAEQGRAEDLAQALALFPRLRERTLQAACLIALHALGGSAPVESALERRTAALRRRVLALLEDAANARGNLTTLARLARAIESSLPAPQT